MAFIGVALRALLSGFARIMQSRAGQWCLAVLATLGISFTTYSVAIEPFTDMIESTMAGMPAQLSEWMGFFWIDKGVSVVIGAYVASVALGAAKRLTAVKRA